MSQIYNSRQNSAEKSCSNKGLIKQLSNLSHFCGKCGSEVRTLLDKMPRFYFQRYTRLSQSVCHLLQMRTQIVS